MIIPRNEDADQRIRDVQLRVYIFDALMLIQASKLLDAEQRHSNPTRELERMCSK